MKRTACFLDFLLRAHERGLRHVLVITARVVRWQRRRTEARGATLVFKAEFRFLISSYETAARHHGGEGALYVRLSRRGGENHDAVWRGAAGAAQAKGVTQQKWPKQSVFPPPIFPLSNTASAAAPPLIFCNGWPGIFTSSGMRRKICFVWQKNTDPRAVIDTSSLPPQYTAFANLLARRIRSVEPDVIEEMYKVAGKGFEQGLVNAVIPGFRRVKLWKPNRKFPIVLLRTTVIRRSP